MPITCQSQITHVSVYARGALVTRQVSLPADVPDSALASDIELIVPGVTLLCEPGSLRATLDAPGRAVVALRSALSVPAAGPLSAQTTRDLRDLDAQIARLQAEAARLGERHKALQAASLKPSLRPALLTERLGARVRHTLTCARTLADLAASTYARLAELEAQLHPLRRRRDALALQLAQAPSAAHLGSGHPTRDVSISLSGAGPIRGLTLTYAVLAARFWPLYTLRLSEGGRRADLLMEALVAQRTLEDWSSVRLSLSTADLLFDARLPELPALRYGRAQPPARKSFRPPPSGLERMFQGHDDAFGKGAGPGTAGAGAAAPEPPPLPQVLPNADELEDTPTGIFDLKDAGRQGEAREEQKPSARPAPKGAPRRPAPPQAPPPLQAPPRAGGPPPGMAPAPAAPPLSSSMAMPEELMPQAPRRSAGLLGAVFGGGGGGRGMDTGEFAKLDMDRDEGGAPQRDEPPLPIEPADAWLDFDSLRLPPLGDPRRGRLVREPDLGGIKAQQAQAALESFTPAPNVRDPRATRGRFDHRYEADGLAQVSSDGLAHRVTLGQRGAAPTLRYRTVPREAPEVYREVDLENPFDAPLLSGPVDVYVDGSLLTTAEIQHIDRGGSLTVGMGVEERVRVARNARVEEESAGLMGGNLAISHTVTLDVTSSLPRQAVLEVVDRVPVTTDKSIEIRRTYARPAPAEDPYKQAERGQPVRGGLLWRLTLPPGGKAQIEFQYRITLPQKSEIVGGNRRE